MCAPERVDRLPDSGCVCRTEMRCVSSCYGLRMRWSWRGHGKIFDTLGQLRNQIGKRFGKLLARRCVKHGGSASRPAPAHLMSRSRHASLCLLQITYVAARQAAPISPCSHPPGASQAISGRGGTFPEKSFSGWLTGLSNPQLKNRPG